MTHLFVAAIGEGWLVLRKQSDGSLIPMSEVRATQQQAEQDLQRLKDETYDPWKTA